MADQKQFEASQKKKNKAREEGQIPRSRELTQSLQLSVCFLMLLFLNSWGHRILDLYHKIIQDTDGFSVENIHACIAEAGRVLMLLLLIWFGILVLISLFSEFMQVRALKFNFNHLAPKLNRLDPWKGLLRVLGEKEGRKPVLGLFNEALQITLIGGVALLVLWFRVCADIGSIFELEMTTAEEGIFFLRSMVMSILRDMVALSMWYGALRYLLSCHRIRNQLRMDFEELKREIKEDEGDPHTKGQRKAMHQEVLLHGMIENVKKAKVVLVSDD